MYFERLNKGLPMHETLGRSGMPALCIFGRLWNLSASSRETCQYSIISEYYQFGSCLFLDSLCWFFLDFDIRSTVKVVVAFLMQFS